MFRKAQPFFIIAETSLHAGSGDDLGIVDLPIQRERHTGFPKIESSGVKGSIREEFVSLIHEKEEPGIITHKVSNKRLIKKFENINEIWKEEKIKRNGNDKSCIRVKYEEAVILCFGPEEGDAHAGALGFTDARILLFPVKSMKGVFAWITCPQIIAKLKKDFSVAGWKDLPPLPAENSVTEKSSLLIADSNIVLEEYTFPVKKDDNCTKLAQWMADNIIPSKNNDDLYDFWREKMKNDIVVLSDDDFRDFVELSTEVIARIRIDNETGTVAKGALFYEEYLPQESILYSLAMATPIFKANDNDKGIFKQNSKTEEEAVLDFFTSGMPEVMQIGGNATIGKGIVRIRIMEG